jgi:hypothetical protein
MAIGVAIAAATNRRPASATAARAGDAIANAISAIGIATATARVRRLANATAAKAGVAITIAISTTGVAIGIAKARRLANRIAANLGAAITIAISAAGVASTIATVRHATSMTAAKARLPDHRGLTGRRDQVMGRRMTSTATTTAHPPDRRAHTVRPDQVMGRRMATTTAHPPDRRAHTVRHTTGTSGMMARLPEHSECMMVTMDHRPDLPEDTAHRRATTPITMDTMAMMGAMTARRQAHTVHLPAHMVRRGRLASMIVTINRHAIATAMSTCCMTTTNVRRITRRSRIGIATA